MSLLNIFKPKWQSPDPLVRLKAVAKLASDDPATDKIIATDDNQQVRQAALAKITDCSHLRELEANVGNEVIKEEINSCIEKILLQNMLKAETLEAKKEVLAAINSEDILSQLAVSEDNPHIRLLAVQRIHDEQTLSLLIEKNCGKKTALAALAQINNAELLSRAAAHANNRAVRAKAAERLAALEAAHHKTTPKEILDEQLSELLSKSKKIATAADPEKAWHDFKNISDSWKNLNPPPDHDLITPFEELGTKINERYNAFISYDAENKKSFFARETRLQQLSEIISSIKDLCTSLDVNSSAKFTDLQNKWRELSSYPGLNITAKLLDQFKQTCRNYSDNQQIINKERAALAEFKAELTNIAALLQKNKFKQTFAAISALSNKVKSWRSSFLDNSEIAASLRDLKEEAEQKKKSQDAEDDTRRQGNLSNRLAILDQVKALLSAADMAKSAKQIAEIKELWAKPVELPDDAPDIDAQFQNLLKDFKIRHDEFFRIRDWQLWQNKTLKDKLIKKAQELDQENNLHLVFKKIKELQKEWREIGPTPAKETNKLWRNFKQATDRNFNRCQIFFQELDEISQVNLAKKVAICRLAQDLQDSEQWRKTADKLKELQKDWQKAGRVPKDREAEIHAAFREACNHFFNRRKDYYQQQDKLRLENLHNKEKLCQQVEELAATPLLEHKEAIRSLQKQWKEIGPVPKEQNDKIWQRFKTSCDSFYQWLDTLKPQNLVQKEELCEQAEALLSTIGPKTKYVEMAKEIANLQKKWRTIGPAPADQHEQIWQRFKKACDIFFDARRHFFAKIDQQRPGNEFLKNKVLEHLHKLIQSKDRGAVKKIIALQEEWPHIGPASKGKDAFLQRQFSDVCNNFFKNRREAFQEIDQVHRDNLKQKEALCLRLELLTGIAHATKAKPGRKQALTLAEQLQLAFESNRVMGGTKNDGKHKKDEFELIIREWQKIGPVPKEHEHIIKRRYETASRAFYKSSPPRKQSVKH